MLGVFWSKRWIWTAFLSPEMAKFQVQNQPEFCTQWRSGYLHIVEEALKLADQSTVTKKTTFNSSFPILSLQPIFRFHWTPRNAVKRLFNPRVYPAKNRARADDRQKSPGARSLALGSIVVVIFARASTRERCARRRHQKTSRTNQQQSKIVILLTQRADWLREQAKLNTLCHGK